MHVYFLGIGGAGIGPLALIASQAGYSVSGSDKQHTLYIDYLKTQGIEDITISQADDVVVIAHDEKPIDWLIYSSAVAMEDLGRRQLEIAKKLGIKTDKRDQFIAEFTAKSNLKMIAIAGSQGKTTTTSMITWLFLCLKEDVSYLIPAKVSFGEMASYSADSHYFIHEADEYDRHFLHFHPALSVISGISWDHHDIYKTREEYKQAFRDFISQSEQVVMWQSDANYLQAKEGNILLEDDDQPKIKEIGLSGLYNRRNAWLAVVSVSKLLNAPIDVLIKHINSFPGLGRRMEEICPNLYSDYAHTPDKIKGAMSVASEIAKAKNKKLIIIYEPISNERQTFMLNDYQDVFSGATKVYWLPTYLVREDPNIGILGPKDLISHLADPSLAEPANKDQKLLNKIKQYLSSDFMVIAMAAGGGNSLDEWLRANF